MKRKLLVFLSAVVASMMLTVSQPAYAAGNIIVDNQNPRVGDSFNVKVSSDSGNATLAFNSDVLQISSISGEATTSGNTIIFSGNSGSVTFKAANTGSSALVLSSNDEKLSSVTLPVTKSKAQEAQEEQAKKAQEQAAQQQAQTIKTGNPDFTVNGTTYSLSDQFSNSDLPVGFVAAQQSIHDQNMKVAQNQTTGMTLVYLKPASDLSQSGTFFVYRSTDDSVSPLQLIGSLQQYVIPQTPDALFRDDLEEVQVTVGDTTYTMYQIPGDTSGLYYIYGTDQTGTMQWFQYDSQSGTVQRINPALLQKDKTATSGSDVEAQKNSSSDSGSISTPSKRADNLLSRLPDVPQIYLAGVLAFVIVVILILVVAHHRKKKIAVTPSTQPVTVKDELKESPRPGADTESSNAEQEAQESGNIGSDESVTENAEPKENNAEQDDSEVVFPKMVKTVENTEGEPEESNQLTGDLNMEPKEAGQNSDVSDVVSESAEDATDTEEGPFENSMFHPEQQDTEDHEEESIRQPFVMGNLNDSGDPEHSTEDDLDEKKVENDDEYSWLAELDKRQASVYPQQKETEDIETGLVSENVDKNSENTHEDIMERLAKRYGSEMVFEQEEDSDASTDTTEAEMEVENRHSSPSSEPDIMAVKEIQQDSSVQSSNDSKDAEPEFKMIDLDDL